jgi:hypothetical protein
MDKSGVRTSEFAVLISLTIIAIFSGLDVNANVITYHANSELLNDLFLAATAYMGLRGGGKIAQVIKGGPAAPEAAPATPPSAEEIVEGLIKKLAPAPVVNPPATS